MLELNCTDEEQIHVTLSPVTPKGKPVALDGQATVTVQDGVGTVAMRPDGSFDLVSGDTPGDTTYLVSADADLGAGVETISDIIILHVAGALARSLGLAAEAPVLKP